VTTEDVQRYARIGIYWICGWLASRGVHTDGAYVELAAGVAGTLANFGWTLYGNQISAKLAEVAKYAEVKKVVVHDPELATDVPSPKVTTR
jgi:hypothetical protein